MRKTVLIILFVFMSSVLCFAQLEFQLFVGTPFSWEEGNIQGYRANTQMNSFSLGFGFTSPINDRLSWCVFDEVILPQKMSITVGGIESSVDRSNYKSLMGMSVLIGASYNIYSDAQGKLKIPLTAGLRWMWLMSSTEYINVFGSNIGASIGPGIEYNVSNKINIFGRVMMYYDFYSSSSISTGYGSTSISGSISSFGVTPNIGVGIKF